MIRGMKCLRPLIMVLVISLGLACATQQAREAPQPTQGFLSEPSLLRPGGEGETLLLYVNSDADFTAYNAVVIDPVTAWRSSDSTLGDVDAEDVQRLVSLLHDVMAKQLGRNFNVLSQARPGTLRIRLALTEAEKSNVALDTVSTVVPVGRVLSTLGELATGTAAFTGEAGLECEILDAKTGALLIAAADRRGGRKTLSGVFNSWDDVEESFRVWASMLRERLLAEGLNASWDQQRVTDLAGELDKRTAKLISAAKVLDRTDDDTETYLLVEDLRRLKRATARLARDLRAGKERISTTPLMLRVVEIVRTIRVRAQTSQMLHDARDEIAGAREVLAKLAGFYGNEWPPPVS